MKQRLKWLFYKLQRFFCRHKFRRISYRFIRQTREDSGGKVMGMPVYANYNNFIEIHECDKCGKSVVRSTQYLAVDHKSSVLY